MKILETRVADDGTILHGIAVSTRGQQYRWFSWADGYLSVDREEEPQRPGGTHWRRLGNAAVTTAIRVAVARMQSAKRSARHVPTA